MVSAVLLKLSFFKALGEPSERKLKELFGPSSDYPKDSHFAHDGDCAENVFSLLSGWAIKYKMTEDGRRQILSFMLPGDVFPLHAGAMGSMDYSIAALADCRASSASIEDFDRVILHDGPLAQAFWWVTMVDKGVLRAWIFNIAKRDAYCRIAHLICELHFRLSMLDLVDDDGGFDFPLRQQDIADAEGLTVVHVNRVLMQLRSDGLIEMGGKRLRLLDHERLCSLADFDPQYLRPS